MTCKMLDAEGVCQYCAAHVPDKYLCGASQVPNYKLTTDNSTAVSTEFYFFPMDTCPKGVKVILENRGGVATMGIYDGKSDEWQGWFPCPRRRR